MRAATEIARFDADVQRARDAVQPLARQLVPSHEWPFVFFHLRKAGGSTVRRALDDAAKAAKVDSFVACQGGVSCTTWGPYTDHHDGKGPDVIGGHFFAPLVDRWASQRWKDGAAVFLRATSASMVPHFSQNGHLSEAGDLRDRRVRCERGAVEAALNYSSSGLVRVDDFHFHTLPSLAAERACLAVPAEALAVEAPNVL